MRKITSITIVCIILISIVSCTKTSRIEELVKQFSMAVLPDTLDFADCKAGDKSIDLKIHDYLLPAIDSISEMAIGSAFSKMKSYNVYPVFYIDPKSGYYLMVYYQTNPGEQIHDLAGLITISKYDEVIDFMLVCKNQSNGASQNEIKTFFSGATDFIVQTALEQNGHKVIMEQKCRIDENGKIMKEDLTESKNNDNNIESLLKHFRKSTFPDTIKYGSKTGKEPIDIKVYSYLIPVIEEVSGMAIENLSAWDLYPAFYIDTKSDFYAIVFEFSSLDEGLPIYGLASISKNTKVIDQILVSEIGEEMDAITGCYSVFENETSFTTIIEHTMDDTTTTTREKYTFEKNGKIVKLSSKVTKENMQE